MTRWYGHEDELLRRSGLHSINILEALLGNMSCTSILLNIAVCMKKTERVQSEMCLQHVLVYNVLHSYIIENVIS